MYLSPRLESANTTSLQEKCPNCGAVPARIYPDVVWRLGVAGRNFGYARCPQCALIMAEPVPTEAEVSSFYAESFNYGLYSARKRLKQLQGADRWRRLRPKLEKCAQDGSRQLLDVGCGHGWFLAAARNGGWACTGLDFPSEATAFAREKLGLKIIEADFLSADLAPGSFDLITLWHALEHMRDPQAVLNRAESLLKPTGLLLVAVPNAQSRGLIRVGAHWIWLQQPFIHLWHFSPYNLTDYFARAGFDTGECSTRDTWDANYVYDARLYPVIRQPFLERAPKFLGRCLRLLGFDAQRVERRAFFFFDEGLRLIAYAVQLILNAARGASGRLDGSELLILAPLRRSAPVVPTKPV